MSFSRAETFPIAISVSHRSPCFNYTKVTFSKAKESEEPYVGLRLAFWIPRVAKANWYQAIIATHAASAPQLVAPKLSGAFFANIDVDLSHFIRRSDCWDL